MTAMVPVILFWGLAAWAMLSRGPALIYLFFAVMPFGSLTVIPPGVTGGLTIMPATVTALLLCIRYLGDPAGLRFTLQAALSPRRLLLLATFWLVAVIATLFMPRIFAGQIDVIPVREVAYGAQPLMPTRQNISQLAYLTVSVLLVFAVARLGRDPILRQHLLRGLMLGAAVLIATGLIDLTSHFLPLGPLLAPFRTATYSILADVEVLNQRRVIGLMPEASSYGGLVIAFLTAVHFLAPAIDNDRLRRLAPVMVLVLIAMAYLSTSSAAYVGLALFAALAGLRWIGQRVASGRPVPRWVLGSEMAMGLGGVTALVVLLLLAPEVFDPIVRLFERMVLEKASSASFEERTYWTAVSWQALLDSFGLGIGVGGTRASSAPVAVIASTGVLGGLLFYGFVIQSLTRRPQRDPTVAAMMAGLRWSYPVPFVMGTLVGTSANFGSFDAVRFGLAFALSATALSMRSNRRPARTRHTRPESVETA